MSEPWNLDRPGRKLATTGTHRAATLEETWRRLGPALAACGVTRVCDVTGLDLIGIPVATAYRPNARSLSVSQGKGVSREASRVSAAMEAVEHAHAEVIDRPLRLARPAELGAAALDPRRLPRTADGVLDEVTPLLWIDGVDVRTGEPRAVPYEAVSLDFTLPPALTGHGLSRDSNGLAGGNSALEALVHALCELIERDAAALWDLRDGLTQAEARIDPSTLTDPETARLLERYDRAGVEAALFDITSDLGVPAVLCHIVEAEPDPFRPLPAATGLGCHPHPAIAVQRALTEAAQSRLITVSGARDDITRERYAETTDLDGIGELRDALRESLPYARPFEAAGADHELLGDDLDWLLDRLAGAGLDQVIAVELTRASLGVPVVKVLVPGLEGAGALTGEPTLPGPRALALGPETADA
ncbi:YcaO-like family protein [Herbidospora cretacea]|uniref:YcaO-like family protein n=1 Tax=Herbidospora cretacea TaxID=28444 RepID=UPI0007745DF4|nr:YcaO-like family protein [Herbidospora cretacea]